MKRKTASSIENHAVVDFREKPFAVISRKERRERGRRGGWPSSREVFVGWSYYSYGRRLFKLTPSERNMDVRRFTTFSLGEPLEYSCKVVASNLVLETRILPWMRAKTKKSGGKWSVMLAADWRAAINGPHQHGDSSPVPMIFSFSNGEDGVLFRLFSEKIISE